MNRPKRAELSNNDRPEWVEPRRNSLAHGRSAQMAELVVVSDAEESGAVNATPIWFGPTDRPLFGWIYLPARVLGGVVLCPPLGLEELSARRTIRTLAERLAARGMVCLRLDYSGTGDSAGELDELAGTDTWIRDIAAAIACVRDTGVSRIGVVGLRLGATLAAEAAVGQDLDALVLWDPCETGKTFLREQRILATAIGSGSGVHPSVIGRVEIPGLLLPKNLADAIGELRLGDTPGKVARRLLLLTRPDRSSSRGLRERLRAGIVEEGQVDGQEYVVDVEPGVAVQPELALDEIASWLERSLDAGTEAWIAPTPPQHVSSATFPSTEGSVTLIERTVPIGDDGLFGIVTESQDADPAVSPAVVLLNAGVLPHSGPARLWVAMARAWAAHGVRVLRFDLAGLGDSPTRPGRRPDEPYPVGADLDIVEAARFMVPEDPAGVVLAGLCSGAYHVLEAGLQLNSRRVWLVNPGVPLVPPELTDEAGRDIRRQAIRPLDSVTRKLSATNWIARLSEATLPAGVWWALDKLHLYRSRARGIESLARKGADILVVCGEPEYARYVKRSKWTVRRLERSSRCHFEVVSSLDHSLFGYAGRSAVATLFTDQLLSKVLSGSD